MISHDKVARAWSNGDEAVGCNMFTDGKTIFSWGTHFPIAHYIGNNAVLFNTDHYSPSTSHHQSIVRGYCNDEYECTTEEIKEAMNTGVAVIHKDIQPHDLNQELEHLKEVCKNMKIKPNLQLINRLARQEVKTVPPTILSDKLLGVPKGKLVLPRGWKTVSISEYSDGIKLKSMKQEIALDRENIHSVIMLLYGKFAEGLVLKKEFNLLQRLFVHEDKYKEILTKIIEGTLTDEDRELIEADIKMRETI